MILDTSDGPKVDSLAQQVEKGGGLDQRLDQPGVPTVRVGDGVDDPLRSPARCGGRQSSCSHKTRCGKGPKGTRADISRKNEGNQKRRSTSDGSRKAPKTAWSTSGTTTSGCPFGDGAAGALHGASPTEADSLTGPTEPGAGDATAREGSASLTASAAPLVDPVEVALADALSQAAAGGRFDVVAQLAKELEARRLARARNVLPFPRPQVRHERT
jgi:hypothetical protein